ncbi:hypothetical protein ACNUDN_29890 [Mycobacterium sp. smrl_JER01]|uniref:hypothetical protein n=1 Tax=Mycobacterium sp. smrl_JER01 TaxID=3402633 RepID=UPI003AC6B836
MPADEHTPRRSLRVPDSEWDAAATAASRNGETLTAVIRRELVRYAQSSDAPDAALVEYRATPKDERFAAVVGITGPLEAVRATYPSRHWILEERTISGYRPARASGSGRVTSAAEHHN